MKSNKDEITIEVSLPPWSESEKSYYLLTEKGSASGSWSRGFWFPKKVCSLCWGAGELTLPRWLFNKLELSKYATVKTPKNG
jgi:hypothetical protein